MSAPQINVLISALPAEEAQAIRDSNLSRILEGHDPLEPDDFARVTLHLAGMKVEVDPNSGVVAFHVGALLAPGILDGVGTSRLVLDQASAVKGLQEALVGAPAVQLTVRRSKMSEQARTLLEARLAEKASAKPEVEEAVEVP